MEASGMVQLLASGRSSVPLHWTWVARTAQVGWTVVEWYSDLAFCHLVPSALAAACRILFSKGRALLPVATVTAMPDSDNNHNAPNLGGVTAQVSGSLDAVLCMYAFHKMPEEASRSLSGLNSVSATQMQLTAGCCCCCF
jgi:hypothetical protein